MSTDFQGLFEKAEGHLDSFKACLAAINKQLTEDSGTRTTLYTSAESLIQEVDDLQSKLTRIFETVSTHPDWSDLFKTE